MSVRVMHDACCIQGESSKYYDTKAQRFDLLRFWAEHKVKLPLHFGVFLAEVGCKKAASSNCESVFSGAGKFTKEASSAGSKLLMQMCKLHYNWKYPYLPVLASFH